MELKQFFIMFRKKILLISFIPILLSIVAFVVSNFFIQPVYEASSTLYIIKQSNLSEELITYEEILINQYLVKDYRELIKSKLITRTVIEDLDITDLTPSMLSGRISVESKNDTRVLEIKVRDTSPKRAKILTDKICEVFIDKSVILMKLNNVRVVDVAEVPSTPVKPKPMMNAILVLALSFVCITGILYLFELLNETIKSSEDVEAYLGLNVLGTIPSFQVK